MPSIVVRPLDTSTKNHVRVWIPSCLDDADPTSGIDAKERVRRTRGNNCVNGDLDRMTSAACSILEADCASDSDRV